ncbi:MAG: insulinase family protein, partial [Clostridia bacterium]|nr:insulinase family protein [Clostridia bacterium]
VSATDCTLQELLCLWDTLFLGESCPMYRELSEDLGLIYSYSDTMYIFDGFAGVGVIYEVRGDKLMQSLETVFDMFESAKTESEKRLPLILPFFTDDGDILLDDAGKIVSDFGYYNHILSCGYRNTEDMKNAFRAVRGERLNELARKVFKPDNLVVAIKGNKKKIDTEAIRRTAACRIGK